MFIKRVEIKSGSKILAQSAHSRLLATHNNGLKNIMEDQYPLIYPSIILNSYLSRKRRLVDDDTKRKLADTQTDALT